MENTVKVTKKTEVDCKFEFCEWSGPFEQLLEHCCQKHKEYVKTINTDENWFRIHFHEILAPTILLSGLNGDLYWFLLCPKFTRNGFRRGIFTVGKSRKCYYFGQIGIKGDITVVKLMHHKVITKEPDLNVEKHCLKFKQNDFMFMGKEDMPSQSMALMFYFDPNCRVQNYKYAVNPCVPLGSR